MSRKDRINAMLLLLCNCIRFANANEELPIERQYRIGGWLYACYQLSDLDPVGVLYLLHM
ncbi:hypothetical protein T4D_6033 [Trichinella pseudospiralis]|uniref:Uncharacterized protein n=1 Tax=Trichinella pseudospiralis TaxID=6337 RepID=A0A0V1FLI3_TRIPS|nr:hypothetical protein T4D_6033 [Trichinella pseudospiralis]